MADRLLLLAAPRSARYGPALGRSAAAVRAASTSTTANGTTSTSSAGNDTTGSGTTGTSTSEETPQRHRRYRLTVNSVAICLRPSWGPAVHRHPLLGPSGWGVGPLSLLDRNPSWLLEVSRPVVRPGWLLERLILSGVTVPRPAEEWKGHEGPSTVIQEEHEPEKTESSGGAQGAEEERQAGAGTGVGPHIPDHSPEGSNSAPDTVSELESSQSDSDSESRVADSESRVADPESRVADSESRGADLESRGADSESKGADSESRGADSESRGADSESRGADSESRGADSESKGADSESIGADSESRGADSESRGADPESAVGQLFRVTTDVSGFSVGEVKVTVSEGAVTVAADQVRETDGGRLRRHLYRRVELPAGVSESQVTITRTGDDTVVAEAPLGGDSTAADGREGVAQGDTRNRQPAGRTQTDRW